MGINSSWGTALHEEQLLNRDSSSWGKSLHGEQLLMKISSSLGTALCGEQLFMGTSSLWGTVICWGTALHGEQLFMGTSTGQRIFLEIVLKLQSINKSTNWPIHVWINEQIDKHMNQSTNPYINQLVRQTPECLEHDLNIFIVSTTVVTLSENRF